MTLKDGYYLAAYVEINEMAYVYDVDTQRHDQNISLWRYSGNDLTLIRYWELERISRIKHHNKAFYSKEHLIKFIDGLLAEEGLSFNDIEDVIGCPELKKSEEPEDELLNSYYYHSICHIYSAMLLDTDLFRKRKVLALSMDLDSDCLFEERSENKNDYVGCFSDKGDMRFFPIESPAPLWSIASHDKKMGEGTLMALASACKTRFKREFDFSDRAFFSSDHKMNSSLYSEIKEEENKCTEENYGEFLCDYDDNFSFADNLTSATMKVVQALSQEIVERNVDRALYEFKAEGKDVCLALSGGFSLNCPCNSYIMNKYGFNGFMAPPCVNDSGQSLGMALYHFFKVNDQINFRFGNAFYGKTYSIDGFIGDLERYTLSCTKANKDDFVKDITNLPLVWFDGESEIGPRALGHRSILSSPLSMRSKDKLNEIKLRQKWRPVAPIVLEQYADKYFKDPSASPFMLRTYTINGNMLNTINAVAHLDNSSRVQTIESDADNISRAVEWFGDATGVYMLCNTSLNDRGEPIIDTPYEAVNFAFKKKMPVVYICNHRLELNLNEKFDLKKFENDSWSFDEVEDKEYPLSKEEFIFFYWSDGFKDLDLNDQKNIKLVKRMFNAYSNTSEWKEKRSLANFYY